jgi:hypothetical protein
MEEMEVENLVWVVHGWSLRVLFVADL